VIQKNRQAPWAWCRCFAKPETVSNHTWRRCVTTHGATRQGGWSFSAGARRDRGRDRRRLEVPCLRGRLST
jgi:hypothetical protein